MESSYPVLTVKDLVIFPHVVVPLFVGRSKSIKALNAAMEADRKIVFLLKYFSVYISFHNILW